jgi:hypothetical protein
MDAEIFIATVMRKGYGKGYNDSGGTRLKKQLHIDRIPVTLLPGFLAQPNNPALPYSANRAKGLFQKP